MKILIKPNLQKPEAVLCSGRIMDSLKIFSQKYGRETQILLGESDSEAAGGREGIAFGDYKTLLTVCDVIITVGGDGTVMRAARSATQAGKPILGVNAGHLGFLTQAEIDEISGLERLFTGKYTIVSRMMLKAVVQNNGGENSLIALNDVVIRHGDADRIVTVEVLQDEKLVTAYRADGVIFSTPTGSTAYSMSAGGPVVSPEMQLLLLTPICSHTAFNSSIVLPPENSYTAREKLFGKSGGMYVSIDGQRICRLSEQGSVTVCKSELSAKFIDLGTREFFDNLNLKLSWR